MRTTTWSRVRAASCAVLAAASAAAQWSSDSGVNTVVADGAGDQAVPIVKPASDGGVWVFFYDSGVGSGIKPRMQRLAADGTRVFAGNGVVLANRQNSATFTSDAEADALGNAYAVFDDDSSGSSLVTVQKVDSNGNLPWGAAGVQVPALAGSFGNRIAVCADGTIVVAGAVSNVLQFQRLNPDGTFVPGEAWSLAEASRGQAAADLITGGSGGDVILLWVRSETTNMVTSRKGLKIQKWDSTHTSLWSGAGGAGSPIDVYTSNATPNRSIQSGYYPAAIPDGAGGAVVAWYDNGADRNAWLQHVLPGGSQRFAQNGLAMSTTSSATEYRLSAAAAYLPAVDEYVVAFERSNTFQSLYGLGAQRVTAAGVRQWGGGQGLELIPLNSGNHKSFISVMPAPTNDAVVAWIEYQGANGPMIIEATRLDEAGAAVWTPAFLGIATNPSGKGRLMVSGVAGSDMLVAAWHDAETGTNDIKAQNINMDGTLGAPPCVGDVNGDGEVGLADLTLLLAAFGSSTGDPNYSTAVDFDSNGAIELSDLTTLLAHFGTTCP
ncbi:MAG: hypothetical protein HZB38_10310 [Planctomycetes bacterium]|nr:hypothetical protein [Planctomycetota bacterium]